MNLPDPAHRPFAKTNIQTIHQRAELLAELLPGVSSIAEICCGDCSSQYEIYRTQLGVSRFCGLDLSPEIVAINSARGVPCLHGNALDATKLQAFLDFEVIFFGPPLSVGCDGHHLLSFQDVTPGYLPFAQLLLDELRYQGTGVFIGPRSTTPGDAQWLYHQVQTMRAEYQLKVIHYSYASVTGTGVLTEPRLKYVELWFGIGQDHLWEVRESGKPAD